MKLKKLLVFTAALGLLASCGKGSEEPAVASWDAKTSVYLAENFPGLNLPYFSLYGLGNFEIDYSDPEEDGYAQISITGGELEDVEPLKKAAEFLERFGFEDLAPELHDPESEDYDPWSYIMEKGYLNPQGKMRYVRVSLFGDDGSEEPEADGLLASSLLPFALEDEEPADGGEEPGDEPGDQPGDEPGDEPGDQPGDEPGDEPGGDDPVDPEPVAKRIFTSNIFDPYVYTWEDCYASIFLDLALDPAEELVPSVYSEVVPFAGEGTYKDLNLYFALYKQGLLDYFYQHYGYFPISVDDTTFADVEDYADSLELADWIVVENDPGEVPEDQYGRYFNAYSPNELLKVEMWYAEGGHLELDFSLLGSYPDAVRYVAADLKDLGVLVYDFAQYDSDGNEFELANSNYYYLESEEEALALVADVKAFYDELAKDDDLDILDAFDAASVYGRFLYTDSENAEEWYIETIVDYDYDEEDNVVYYAAVFVSKVPEFNEGVEYAAELLEVRNYDFELYNGGFDFYALTGVPESDVATLTSAFIGSFASLVAESSLIKISDFDPEDYDHTSTKYLFVGEDGTEYFFVLGCDYYDYDFDDEGEIFYIYRIFLRVETAPEYPSYLELAAELTGVPTKYLFDEVKDSGLTYFEYEFTISEDQVGQIVKNTVEGISGHAVEEMVEYSFVPAVVDPETAEKTYPDKYGELTQIAVDDEFSLYLQSGRNSDGSFYFYVAVTPFAKEPEEHAYTLKISEALGAEEGVDLFKWYAMDGLFGWSEDFADEISVQYYVNLFTQVFADDTSLVISDIESVNMVEAYGIPAGYVMQYSFTVTTSECKCEVIIYIDLLGAISSFPEGVTSRLIIDVAPVQAE